MNCEFCGREEALPFVCNYCGGAYCADHRLPEAHQCKGDLTQKRTITAPPQTTFSWRQPEVQPSMPSPTGGVFSRIEIRDILIAWLGIGLAFGIANIGGIFGLSSLRLGGRTLAEVVLIYTAIALVTVGPGFVLHELSHKFVARRYGFWAEFRMWPQMLFLAILMSLSGFLFAAPGATYISGTNISKSENAKISVAGPLTNVAIALLFVPLLWMGNVLGYIGGVGIWVNVWLATFNLIPLGPLDGAKVFRWSIPAWALLFVPLAITTAYVATRII